MTSRIYPDRQPASDAAPMSAGIRRYRGSPASDLPVVDAESRPTRLDVHTCSMAYTRKWDRKKTAEGRKTA